MTRRRLRLPERPDGTPVLLTRRGFLGGTGAVAVGGAALAGCTTDHGEGVSGPTSTRIPAAVERSRQFFTPTEALLVEAVTARLLPGDALDPGAREAEVVVYIDNLLASGGWGGEPIYRGAPFITADDVETEWESDEEDDGDDDGESAEGDESGSPDLGTTSFGITRRPIDSFDRYGEQSIMTPAEVYRDGLPRLDQHAINRFGSSFTELDEAEQDAVLEDVEDGEADTFDDPSGEDLFALLVQHTIEGMFGDPMYGGNRDMVGWQLIGYPGAQRAYSPEEMLREVTPRPPQSLDQLPHFEPGRASGRDEPVLPLAGSDAADGHERHQRAGRP